MGLEIEDGFKRLIADHLKLDLGKITDEATLDLLGADSLDRTEIAINIREEYDLENDLPDWADDKKTTIRQLWDYVQKQRSLEGYKK